jgi:hypothetical protein
MLVLTLSTGDPNPPTLALAVAIVAKPVVPVPDAGYAHLRRDPNEAVECVRFAFSPAATRVELVDPSDLTRQVVRRRAIFQWMDTRRIGHRFADALQKTTAFGSTHFPSV